MVKFGNFYKTKRGNVTTYSVTSACGNYRMDKDAKGIHAVYLPAAADAPSSLAPTVAYSYKGTREDIERAVNAHAAKIQANAPAAPVVGRWLHSGDKALSVSGHYLVSLVTSWNVYYTSRPFASAYAASTAGGLVHPRDGRTLSTIDDAIAFANDIEAWSRRHSVLHNAR